jgi:two-component system OmpR family response regulator
MVSVTDPASHRILVVEDDEDIRDFMLDELRRERFDVVAAGSVEAARARMNDTAFDLLLLDLGLPDGDGVQLCRDLRANGFGGWLMMVTARDAPVDRVLGLELGADDYLAKPFEPRELLARVRNLLRRHEAKDTIGRKPRGITRFGPWRLDLRQRCLFGAGDRLVMLSGAEFRLLTRFLEAPDRVLSREELYPERGVTVGFDRSLDVQISRLRQKLATEPGGANAIRTVRNEGYVLPGPVTSE